MMTQKSEWKVNPDKNYKRISNGDVLTGKQVNYLLELAKPEMQAIILLDIWETDEIPNVTSFEVK